MRNQIRQKMRKPNSRSEYKQQETKNTIKSFFYLA